MYKIIITALILSACTNQDTINTKPTKENPTVVLQDIESCNSDAKTPWCESACKTADYDWCIK